MKIEMRANPKLFGYIMERLSRNKFTTIVHDNNIDCSILFVEINTKTKNATITKSNSKDEYDFNKLLFNALICVSNGRYINVGQWVRVSGRNGIYKVTSVFDGKYSVGKVHDLLSCSGDGINDVDEEFSNAFFGVFITPLSVIEIINLCPSNKRIKEYEIAKNRFNVVPKYFGIDHLCKPTTGKSVSPCFKFQLDIYKSLSRWDDLIMQEALKLGTPGKIFHISLEGAHMKYCAERWLRNNSDDISRRYKVVTSDIKPHYELNFELFMKLFVKIKNLPVRTPESIKACMFGICYTPSPLAVSTEILDSWYLFCRANNTLSEFKEVFKDYISDITPKYIPKIGDWIRVKNSDSDDWSYRRFYGYGNKINEVVCYTRESIEEKQKLDYWKYWSPMK